MVKNLITGIAGFVASHMADYLLGKGEEVYGTYRWTEDLSNIRHIRNKVHLIPMDLNDLSSCIKCIEKVRPDYIFHLAAQSFVGDSYEYPLETIRTNTLGTLNLLESVRMVRDGEGREDFNPIVHVCSSSEVYGLVEKEDVPIKETTRFNPSNPYAVGKVGADMAALLYYTNYGLKTIRTRMFTHSVSRWTPVIIKQNNLIDIKYISDIRKTKRNCRRIWNLEKENLEIWNDKKWTRIINISCHPINKHKMLEIASLGGCVCATDNHSIIGFNGQELEAGKLRGGEKIKLTSLPNSEITDLDKEVAWLYGLMVAEGDISDRKIRISNKDITLLEKARDIILRKFGLGSSIYPERAVYRLSIIKCKSLANMLYPEFYASDKNKRIPMIILNAKENIKLEFLRGYNLGDGDINNKVKSEFYRFKTKSPLLAMGLCFISNALNLKYRIHVEHRGLKAYYEIRLLNQRSTKNENWLLLDGQEVKKITEIIYKGEVWDFETENHWFNAGIGGAIVHNTGPRRVMMSAEVNFAKQIAEIEAGVREPVLHHGNLDSVRTWSDVRDAVSAYYLLVRKCKPGEVYNIGGSTTKTIGEMLSHLLSLSPMKDKINLFQDPSLMRPYDVTLQIPDISKFVNETGWKPNISFEQMLKDLLEFWREKVKSEK